VTDVLSPLPISSWRGIEFPVTDRTVTFAHDTVDQKIQFRNGFPVDITGAQSMRFRYTVPLDEGIVRGPFKNLFTATLKKFFDAVYDKTPGVLVDPVYGVFTCKPVLFDEKLRAQIRSGTVVDVEFVQHVEVTDETELELATLKSAESQAGALDREVASAPWPEDEEFEPSVDPLAQIAGYGRQLEFIGNRFVALLDKVAYRTERIEAAAEALESPDRAGIIRAARRTRLATLKLKSRGTNPGKTIRRLRKNADMTLSAIAAEVGMTLDDLLKINPMLATKSVVEAGTPVNYWKST